MSDTLIVGGLDFETTGFLEPEHRIIEAHVSRYELDKATFVPKLLDKETWRIDPQRPIDAKARAVHGISETDLIGKPKFGEVGPAISTRLGSCDWVVAHNGYDFDFPFFIQECERTKVAIPDFNPFDTMIEGRWATPFGKAPSLQELCWACGEHYDQAQAHAADYDVDRMMSCFFFGLKRGVFSLVTS